VELSTFETELSSVFVVFSVLAGSGLGDGDTLIKYKNNKTFMSLSKKTSLN
jgi:hypothetical protein